MADGVGRSYPGFSRCPSLKYDRLRFRGFRRGRGLDVHGRQQIGQLRRDAAQPLRLHQRHELVEQARHGVDRPGGDLRVERGRFELAVAQQDLDHVDIDILLQQMGGEAMAPISPKR